jgi:hypothetical protein
MSKYGNSTWHAEWTKWVVFKLSNLFGFESMWVLSIIGSLLIVIATCIMPGGWQIFFDIPILDQTMNWVGLTPKVMYWANWALIAITILSGVACWCRVAVICYPKVFDRYKIKGVPI